MFCLTLADVSPQRKFVWENTYPKTNTKPSL